MPLYTNVLLQSCFELSGKELESVGFMFCFGNSQFVSPAVVCTLFSLRFSDALPLFSVSRRILFDNLFAEESRNILVDMRIPELELALLSQEILRVDVRYFDPITRATVTLRPVILSLDRTLGNRPANDRRNLEVEVARLTFAVSEVRHNFLGWMPS